MTLVVYNMLTRKKEEFVPLEPGRVKMYVCGPTVYDHAHVGHAKLYVAMDIIVRYLRYSGYQVRFVQNITDVGHLLDTGEDRVLKGALRDRIEPMEVVERYMRSYLDDMDALNNIRPDIMPRASGHVPEQIAATKTLIEKQHAYEVNGSVYFDVSSFPEYGKLSGRLVEEMEDGARVEIREEKRRPEDFALWKRAEPEHIMRWTSPWSEGFPGWHIECTAMATKYLGDSFDIHGGGLENMFPHNECEIAQSEALTGQTFAKYWLLGGSLTAEGVKMSKSLGNSVTISQVLDQYPAQVLRFFILSGHYRSPIDYSSDSLKAARRGWQRMTQPVNAVRQRLGLPSLPDQDTCDIRVLLDETRARFVEAMDDDFNSASALAVLFDFSKRVNAILRSESQPSRSTLEAIEKLYKELAGEVLGVYPSNTIRSFDNKIESGLIQLLIDTRTQARQRKDFATSDAIRDQLVTIGVILEDGKEGTSWKLAPTAYNTE